LCDFRGRSILEHRFTDNIATVKRLLLKSEKTWKRRRISGFFRSIFFWHKNGRVGGKILGLVGRSETHIFLLGLGQTVFRGEESKKSANQKQESPMAAMFFN
jgi:hypothetical protein